MFVNLAILTLTTLAACAPVETGLLWSSINDLPATLTCSYTVVHPRTETEPLLRRISHSVQVSTREAIAKLAALPLASIDAAKPRKLSSAQFSVGMEGDWHNDEMVSLADIANNSSTLYLFEIKSIDKRALFCFEVFTRLRLFDVYLPLRIENADAMQVRHSVYELESMLGLPFIMPAKSASSMFNDKVIFTEWMLKNGLGQYVPGLYNSIESVVYPVVVKPIKGYSSINVTVVDNFPQLSRVTSNLKSTPYLLQEALAGEDESNVEALTRNGRLLGVFCVVHHRFERIFVIGGHDSQSKRSNIDCEELDRLTGILSIVIDIVAKSKYNGLIGLQFKVMKANTAKREPVLVRDYTTDMPIGKAIVISDFTQIADPKSTPAFPVFIEVNPRINGPMSIEPVALHRMLQLYIESM